MSARLVNLRICSVEKRTLNSCSISIIKRRCPSESHASRSPTPVSAIKLASATPKTLAAMLMSRGLSTIHLLEKIKRDVVGRTETVGMKFVTPPMAIGIERHESMLIVEIADRHILPSRQELTDKIVGAACSGTVGEECKECCFDGSPHDPATQEECVNAADFPFPDQNCHSNQAVVPEAIAKRERVDLTGRMLG